MAPPDVAATVTSSATLTDASSKASAVAHPIQGLVKYHGLRDPVRRIPFHGSISVCTGPTHTHTTFALLDDANARSSATIDGQAVEGRAWDRVCSVVRALQEHAEDDRPFHMESRNSFPQFVGLGSSSSGFAALAMAAAEAYGLAMPLEQLSEFARLGAGSACRSVTGGVSEWVIEGERSYSRQILSDDALDWHIVVPLVNHLEPTEGVHQEVLTSPLFDARVAYIPGALDRLRNACHDRDLAAIGATAEADTLNLHAITMTGESGHLTWQPATVAVMQAVKRLRAEGHRVWFSIDTGATAYLNTDSTSLEAVAATMAGLDGVADVLRLRPAGPAHLVSDHLF